MSLMPLFGQRRERTVIGLDIGTRHIKAVEARGGLHPRVRRTAEVLTPAGAVVGSVIVQPDRVATAIKSVLQRLKASTKEVAVAVGGSSQFLRRLALPRMPAEELRATLELQPERFIPFAKEGAVFDLALLGDTGAASGEINVLLAAAPNKAVEGLLEACKLARIKVVKIDVETLALHRALVAAEVTLEKEPVGILDIGAEVARLSLFEAGTPIVTRSLEIGTTLQELLLTGSDAGNLPELMADLLLDLRRSMDFALPQYQIDPPRRLYLVGGGSILAQLAEIAEAYLRTELPRLSDNFQVMVPNVTGSRVMPSHLLAYGLALAMEGVQS